MRGQSQGFRSLNPLNFSKQVFFMLIKKWEKMADIPKVAPILKHTPFIGSATNKTIHKTDVKCPLSLEIIPQERWYIKDIPQDGNYIKCPICFPEEEAFVEEKPQEIIEKIPAQKKKPSIARLSKKKPAKKQSAAKKNAAGKKTAKKSAPKKKAALSPVKKAAPKKKITAAKGKTVSRKSPAVSGKPVNKKTK